MSPRHSSRSLDDLIAKLEIIKQIPRQVMLQRLREAAGDIKDCVVSGMVVQDNHSELFFEEYRKMYGHGVYSAIFGGNADNVLGHDLSLIHTGEKVNMIEIVKNSVDVIVTEEGNKVHLQVILKLDEAPLNYIILGTSKELPRDPTPQVSAKLQQDVKKFIKEIHQEMLAKINEVL